MVIGFGWDGTLVESWTATPLPGVRERLAALPPDTRTFIATNQAGPAWRQMTGDAKYPTAEEVAQRIVAGLAALDWKPDALFIAIHPGERTPKHQYWYAIEIAAPIERQLEHTARCVISSALDDRKPNPGMLLDAADHVGVASSDLVFIGDMDTDRQAAVAAGCRYLDAAEWRKG